MPSLWGAGILALVVRHANCAYQAQNGYVHGDGGDIVGLPAENIDLSRAQAKCDANPQCQAISYAGSTGGTPKVYYKNTVSPFYNDCWKSYAKTTRYGQADGFLPAGDDLSVASSMSDAIAKCGADSACAGFSNRETDDKYYLKRKYSQPHNDCWTTLVKTAEAPAPYYSGDYYGTASTSTYYGAAASSAYYGASATYY